jgi:endonuclease I
MKKILVALFILVSSGLLAQIPSNYYATANGKSGVALKAALNDIIDNHTEYSYSDLWDILKVTDRDPNDANKVKGIYSQFSMDAAAEYDGGAGWNREHVWAKSRGDFGTTMGAGTDIHHLRAEDVSTNSARNNRSFDIGGTPYVDASGNYSGPTPAKTSSSFTWEPGDDQKGDVARMIFYMAVRYEGEHGELDLELTEEVLGNTDKTPFHGRLSTLLTWHNLDPVSAEEINRNNLVYGYQNNRNPFIDHPEYISSIWSGSEDTGAYVPMASVIISEYVEGSSNNKAIEIANIGTVSIDLATISLKKQTDGMGDWVSALSLNGSLAINGVYVLVNSNAHSTLTDKGDLVSSSSLLTFNGNDPIGLFVNDTLIDVIGTFDGGSVNFAIDQTVRRNTPITASNTTYTASEWTSEAIDNFDDLGVFGEGSSSSNGGVLISEYVEGSSYNKAIEITNYTSAAINLSQYELKKQTNGTGSWSSGFSLSGTLGSQNVYVVAHSSSSSALTSKADVTTTSVVINFNGNDPVGLFLNGILVDVVGDFDGGSANFAQDVTLQRGPRIVQANTTYTTNEWVALSKDDFSNVGVINGGSSLEKKSVWEENKIADLKEMRQTDFLFYPNPIQNQLNIQFSDNVDKVELQLYNAQGKLIETYLLTEHTSQIEMSQFEVGIYIVRYSANDIFGTEYLILK